VDYINEMYEKETSLSMVTDSQIFDQYNKYMHPSGSSTEFKIKADSDSIYNLTFKDRDVSLNNKYNLQQLG